MCCQQGERILALLVSISAIMKQGSTRYDQLEVMMTEVQQLCSNSDAVRLAMAMLGKVHNLFHLLSMLEMRPFHMRICDFGICFRMGRLRHAESEDCLRNFLSYPRCFECAGTVSADHAHTCIF